MEKQKKIAIYGKGGIGKSTTVAKLLAVILNLILQEHYAVKEFLQ